MRGCGVGGGGEGSVVRTPNMHVHSWGSVYEEVEGRYSGGMGSGQTTGTRANQ
jgi:hypothetical protein